MNKRSFTPLPPHSGIYIVKNETTGHVYVGRTNDMARRFSEWRHAMIYRRALKNGPIAELLDQYPIDHWTFAVLYENDSATPGELAQYELKAITKLRASIGAKLLNSNLAASPIDAAALHKPQGSYGRVTLVDFDGNEISQAQGAAILGCRADTLKKRLGRLYKQGVSKISLKELSK